MKTLLTRLAVGSGALTGLLATAPAALALHGPTNEPTKITVVQPGGFDWGDAAVGAAVTAAVFVVASLIALYLSRHGHKPTRPHKLVMPSLLLALTSLALVAAGTSGTAASATPPQHEKFPFSEEVTYPAETLCDFTYHQSVAGEVNQVTFADGSFVNRQIYTVTHTNLDTGYALTEHDSTGVHIDLVKGVEMDVGVFWKLRDASGKLVVVHAGQMVFDLASGALVKFTPNADPDFAGVVCPALGGHPATP